MKRLTTYVTEKFRANKDMFVSLIPKSFNELRKIIEQRYEKQGSGTKQNPIDFNDIDVSEMTTFYDDSNGIGIFERIEFEYIDVSDWDVSGVEDVSNMFRNCYKLESVGNLSKWNVSKVEKMNSMFYYCPQLKSVGDLSNWNVSNVKDMYSMFDNCDKLKSIGDLSKWDISNVKDMSWMFANSGITNIPNWYKE